MKREMRVFPPQAQTVTKNHQHPNVDASDGESVAGGAGFRRELRRTADELRGRRSRRADDGRRDERRKTDTTDSVSPLTALGGFGRLGAKPEER